MDAERPHRGWCFLLLNSFRTGSGIVPQNDAKISKSRLLHHMPPLFCSLIATLALVVVLAQGRPQGQGPPQGRCVTPNGSPCGPAAICSETQTGYACTQLYRETGCPTGCSPDESCVQNNNGKYACECNQGFFRPHQRLPCMALGTEVTEERQGDKIRFRITKKNKGA